MNTRLIAIISSIAILVSSTMSPRTDTSGSTTSEHGGSFFSSVPSAAHTSQKASSLPSTHSTSTANSSLSNQSQKTSGSTTPTLTSTTSVTTPDKTTNTQTANPNCHANNITNTTNTHTSNINSSLLQPDGSGENTTQVSSFTTEEPKTILPKTTENPTASQCNCSKYLEISTASVNKQTETRATQPIPTSTPSINTTTTTHTLSPNSTTLATMSSKTTSISPVASSLHTVTTTPTTTITPTITSSGTILTSLASTSSTTNAKSQTPASSLTSTTTPSSTTTTPTTTSSRTTTSSGTILTSLASTSSTTNAKSQTPASSLTTTTTPSSTTTTPTTTSSGTSTSSGTILTSLASTSSTTNAKSPTLASSLTTTTTPSSTTTTPTTTPNSPPTQKAPKTHIPAVSLKRRRRGVVNIESEDTSIVDDDTFDIQCMNSCNITMNETTVPPLTTTTERPTTTTPRHRSIDLSGKLVDLNLVIVVKGTFTQDLTNKSSSGYTNIANQYKSTLKEFYRRLLPAKFGKIVILGFSNGSIKCNYSLEMKAPINESDANSTLQILRDVNWKNASLTNLTVDENKTAAAQAVLLPDDLVFFNLLANVCTNNEVVEWDNNGNPICKYKCDIQEYKVKCGDHGECSFTYGGIFRCICKDGYSGDRCKTPKPTTTTAKPTKPDAIALSKIDIIGIAAGIGGGLVLILLVALCCLCTRLNKAKKRDRFYGYMDNDKEFLHDENSRIENVPEYTNQGYQREEDELQMQRFEPEGKNVDYEPGQRQGAYEREDNAYRKVEEPEGGNVLIYQPKHLRGPMERQSGASKFDEVEERSHPYRMMDTDTTYKIRRPTVNSDKNVPYN